MTNAIEQTRREMYEVLRRINNYAKMNCHVSVVKLLKDFNDPLEAHLEALQKSGQRMAQSIMDITEERDTLRNRLQAFEMASQTSAEIIKGLRAELEKANRSFNCTINPIEEARKNARMQDLMRACTSAQDSKESASSAKTDPYTLGYSSVGKCSNPFPINTVERLHWNDGYQDALINYGNCP